MKNIDITKVYSEIFGYKNTDGTGCRGLLNENLQMCAKLKLKKIAKLLEIEAGIFIDLRNDTINDFDPELLQSKDLESEYIKESKPEYLELVEKIKTLDNLEINLDLFDLKQIDFDTIISEFDYTETIEILTK
jgi:hypothetical protein